MDILSKVSPSTGPGSPKIVGFYEPVSGSCQYIAICEATKKAALIDVVLNFDTAAARTSTDHAQWALDYLEREELELDWILDTHPHADHLMASAWLKERTGRPTGIGEKVHDIAELWREIYHMPDVFNPEADFDQLFAEGDTFRVGECEGRVMLSPGHTLGSVTYYR